jgi:TolB protein
MTLSLRRVRQTLCLVFIAVTAVVAVAVVGPTPAAAQLRIDITRGVVEPIPIAIPAFAGDSAETQRLGRDIASVVSQDLERSGLFRPLDVRALEASQPPLDAVPQFADWRPMNAQALVVGRTTLLPDGRLRVEFRLWDVFAEQQLEGLAYNTEARNWRRIAHIIADAIYRRITGEQGFFDTRIAYVAESGPANRRVKRLAIMDQDGANIEYLTDGSTLVLTPRFSPSGQQLAYLRFVDGTPRLVLRDLATRREEIIGNGEGMTFAGAFSPDGQRIAYSVARDGNTDIYLTDLRTRATRRLTSHTAIDTSPSFSPDGRQIVFNSDRSGSPQLYIMDSEGQNVRRISFGEGRYATPVWSPRGELIAFTRIQGGRFSIGVMRPDGSGERVLASGFRVEAPTWAPSGRVVTFFRKEPWEAAGSGGRARLVMVDIAGRQEREIPTPQDASDPAWSPPQP